MKNNLEKVIITGGAGFIGSNLANHLFKNGTKEILIVDDFSTFGNQKNKRITLYRKFDYDIYNCDMNDLNRKIAPLRPAVN